MKNNELRAEMARHGDNNLSLAKALGITEVSVSRKINNRSIFTQTEIQILADRYNLSAEDIGRIFFTLQV